MHRGQAPPQVQSTLAKMSLCRTAALGGRLYECAACDHQAVVYNSCGDRHCPQCGGAKRANWLDSTAKLILPGVDYYQVVFTIPNQLSSLALGNRRVMFNLLFRSAWRSLKRSIEDEQLFEPAAAMVLHTWSQKLDAHIHVHALVPGGGPSLTNANEWKSARPPVYERQNRFWLVDADSLRVAFRTEFLAGLRQLHVAGELKLDGEWESLRDAGTFERWLQPLEAIDWVTFIQPPPPNSSAENVLKYLARYMTGGPISDRRLVDFQNGMVTFSARTGTTTGGSDETEDIELPVVEFVRRWSLHILPKGFTKTRRYGGFSNHHAQRYLGQCHALLNEHCPKHDQIPVTVERSASPCCPECRGEMSCVSSIDSPGWSVVMHGRYRPWWYDDG